MSELRSAPVPEVSAEDHARGPASAPLIIEYADFECPYCAAASQSKNPPKIASK